jgi:hypothetical protein
MTDPELTDYIERIIRDYVHPGGGLEEAATEIVRQLPVLLFQEGWMPPAKTERIFGRVHEWTERTARLPQDPGPGVLTSHLSELAAILADR